VQKDGAWGSGIKPGRILLTVTMAKGVESPAPGSHSGQLHPHSACSAAIDGDLDCRGAEAK